MTICSKIRNFGYRCIPTTHSTTPSVVIKDARLGFLKFFFTLCIISYVGVYSFLYKKGWAAEAFISTSVQGHFLMPPAEINCTVGQTSGDDKTCFPYSYSDFGRYGTENSRSSIYKLPFPYCTPSVQPYYNHTEYNTSEDGQRIITDEYVYSDGNGNGRGKANICVGLDSTDLTVAVGDTTFFLATWWKKRIDELKKFDPSKLSWSFVGGDRFWKPRLFILDHFSIGITSPENFTLVLDHSYRALNMDRDKHSNSMVGFLSVSNQDLCDSKQPANNGVDPYEPNTLFIGDPSDLTGTYKNLKDHHDDTKCLLNLNRTYECMVARNDKLRLYSTVHYDRLSDPVPLDLTFMRNTPSCYEDHYLIDTLLLASWDGSNSYNTPLLDSPNMNPSELKTCLQEQNPGTQNNIQVCNGTEDYFFPDGRRVNSSFSRKPTPLPHRMTGLEVRLEVTYSNEALWWTSNDDKFTLRPETVTGSSAKYESVTMKFTTPESREVVTKTGLRFTTIFQTKRVLQFDLTALLNVWVAGFLLLVSEIISCELLCSQTTLTFFHFVVTLSLFKFCIWYF